MKRLPSPNQIALTLALVAPSSFAAPGLAPWLTQIGETSAILSAANWGKGQIIGVVDTGINASNYYFAPGQVSATLSGCAAVSFRCSNGVADDNGHGTAVASIAAANTVSRYSYYTGGYTVAQGAYIGVAPNANIVAEKVLNASGSGYSSDVANGINRAAAAGASVINLSLTYGNSADLVAAVNAAAAKGAFIVWAAGNSALPLNNGANSTGLTAAAIQRLLIVGALDTSGANRASFSNTAGSGSFIATTGARTTYASRFVNAPGMYILAPSLGGMGTWSGTSMAAPVVTGALSLLLNAWPILKTNGTGANLLIATSKDLGAKGVDTTYGAGGINLGTAFQPYGSLQITQANGKSIAVSSLTGSMITSGALGPMTTVKNRLSAYTALDGYARNFTVNLSGLIQAKPTGAVLNPLPSNTNTGVTKIKLDGGAEMLGWQAPAVSAIERIGIFKSDDSSVPSVGYMALTNAAGSTLAAGYGVPSQFSYAKALYGSDNVAHMAAEMGISNLSDLAMGGYHMAYGAKVGQDSRMAISFAQTPIGFYAGNPAFGAASGNSPTANYTMGFSSKLRDDLTAGVSFSMLDETSGLLGSSYSSNSAMGLGANRTGQFGVSLAYAFDDHNSVLFEAGEAVTKAAEGTGLLAGTTALRSRSYGVTYMARQLVNAEDRLAVSLKQPLRVASGQVGVVTPSIDADTGVVRYGVEMVSLVPSGRELDFKMNYSTPINKVQSLSFQLGARKDVFNVSGNNDFAAGATWTAAF